MPDQPAGPTAVLAFIHARLDEERKTAESASAAHPWRITSEEGERIEAGNRGDPDHMVIYDEGGHSYEDADHIVLQDPQHTLVRVAALRELAADHGAFWGEDVDAGAWRWWCLPCEDRSPCAEHTGLAAIWSWHPDHRKDWTE